MSVRPDGGPGPGGPTPAGRERTRLAYQRTALSLVAGAALLARLTTDRLGLVSLTGLVVAGPLALWVTLARAPTRDGRPAAALCVATVVLAALVLAAVVLG